MEISLGFGLFKSVLDRVKRIFLFKAYIISHNYYLKFDSKLCFSYLVEHIGYDLKLENKYLSNKEAPMSELYIQTKEGNQYTNFTGYIKAINGKINYQNPLNIELEDDEQIIVVHLPCIPLKELYIHNGNICTTYKEIIISGTFKNQNGKEKKIHKNIGMPTYTEFLNSHWKKRWDQIWNLDFLEDQFVNMQQQLIYTLAGPMAFVRNYYKKSRFFKYSWTSFVVNVIANDKLLRVYWVLLMPLRIKKLKKQAIIVSANC